MSATPDPAVVEERHCRGLATHEPHQFRRRQWIDGEYVPAGPLFACPGNPHVGHDERCCPRHGTHSMPHNGCILR